MDVQHSSMAFEIIYVLLWYFGLANKFAALDFTSAYWQVYLPMSLLFVIMAAIGR